MPVVVTTQELQAGQKEDELAELIRTMTSLSLQKLKIDGQGPLYCDTSTGTVRPYVPKNLRR